MIKRFAFWGIGLTLCASEAFTQSVPESSAVTYAGLLFPARFDEQKTDMKGANHDKQSLFGNFFEDEGKIWSSPFHMDWDDAAIWGGLTATTAILISVDEPVSGDFRRFQDSHAWVQRASPVATQFGQFYVPFGVAALYCLKGIAFDEDRPLETGKLVVEAMIHSGIVVQSIKHMAGRSRPFVYKGKDNWFGPQAFFRRYYDRGFSPYDAFPSGHTITAFTLATVIAERERPWVGVLAYSCAGLCGLSRITQGQHWFSDVFVGAALGIAIGKLEVVNYERRLAVYPVFGTRSAGVSIQLN